MRKDFKYLLCETYRHLSHDGDQIKGRKKAIQKWELDDWSHPKTQPMGMGRGTKAFGENLKPLIRFLRKNVGKKWDKIYSEIKASCPSDGAVNAHVYQHLFWFVETKAKLIDGVYFNVRMKKIEDRGNDLTFFVDKNGILQRAPRRNDIKPKKEKGYIKFGKKFFCQKDGIWYEMIMSKIPDIEKKSLVKEVDGKSVIVYYDVTPMINEQHIVFDSHFSLNYKQKALKIKQYYGSDIYCSGFRQINKKEIKKILQNKA